MLVRGCIRSSILAVAVLGYVPEARAGEIVWYTDLKQATAAAQKADLPMFIDFWAEWCASCKAMDEHVYTNPAVIDAFKRKIIGVRLHFDLHQALARAYNVGPLPHLVFTNSLGMPLVFHRGFLGAAELTAAVSAMPPMATLNALDRRLREDKNSFLDLLAMARALRTAAFFDASTAYYERAARHAKAGAAARQAILYEMALSFLELQDGVQAVKALDKSLKSLPGQQPGPDFLLALGRAHVLTGRHDQARQALEALVRHYPRSNAASLAAADRTLRAILQPVR